MVKTDSATGGKAGEPKSVLLIEDDARIAAPLVERLASVEIETVVAGDGELGALLAFAQPFDLMILDLAVPPIPGLEVLRLFKADRPLTPVIALTSDVRPEWREQVLRAGATECLTKPILLEDLEQRVLALTRRDASPSIWVLADRRYLQRRMPLALVDWLRDEGHPVRFAIVDEEDSSYPKVRPGDLLVGRTRQPSVLALLEEAEARGVRSLNPARGIRRVLDKAGAAVALAEAGVPVADGFARNGDHGIGRDPRAAATDLYVVGRTVWAVRRSGAAAPVESALRDLALACGQAFGLRLYGVHVLESRGRQVVAGVTEFPDYTGVDDAPVEIGCLLLNELH